MLVHEATIHHVVVIMIQLVVGRCAGLLLLLRMPLVVKGVGGSAQGHWTGAAAVHRMGSIGLIPSIGSCRRRGKASTARCLLRLLLHPLSPFEPGNDTAATTNFVVRGRIGRGRCRSSGKHANQFNRLLLSF